MLQPPSENSNSGVKDGLKSPSSPPTSSGTGQTRSLLWLFRLGTILLALMLALGALEAGFRLAGSGYSSRFFRNLKVGNREILVGNNKPSLCFFPLKSARMPPRVLMQAKKAPGVYRIFILGESTAMGEPELAYGPGRYLEELLRTRFPEQQFEVVNVRMPSINSHGILSLARECSHYKGDLWVICMGNNEMLGVFGARDFPLSLVRLTLALQQTRIGKLLLVLSRKLSGASLPASWWSDLQFFAEKKIKLSERRKATVYRYFQRNLEDILQVGVDSGAGIIVGTVPVSLRDCPPFLSLSNSNLPAANRARFDKLYAEGSLAKKQGRFEEAAQIYAEASSLDPGFAEAHFLRGESLLHLDNYAAARQQFQLACDLDALPARTDSRINELIVETCRQFAATNVALCDAAGLFATNSPAGSPGEELFYGHADLNFDGNYRLARAWAEQVKRFLPARAASHAAGDWASQSTCESRLGLTDWNRSRVLNDAALRLEEPPLGSQPNHSRRAEALEHRRMALQMTAFSAEQAQETYLAALKREPNDHYLHESFADFLEAVGDFKQAAAEWQRVRDLLPRDYLACFKLGTLLLLQGNWADAQTLLSQAVALRPDFGAGWLELGNAHAADGNLAAALPEYERARQLEPFNPGVCFHVARVLLKSKRPAKAIRNYRQAIRLDPVFWEAHFELGRLLALESDLPAAKNEFEETVRLKPDFAAAHLNLGAALMKQGELNRALWQFEETVFLEPTNKFALAYISQLRAARNRAP